MLETYVLFLISATLVIISGMKLSKYGDVIANNTNLGHGIVGGVLIAGATSLPEFVTSISSSLIGAPDIAIGNVYGSNIFNLMILAVADILHGQGRFLWKVKMNHILAGLFGVLLSALGALSILVNQIGGLEFEIGWVSINSLFIFMTYGFGSILIIRYENKLSRIIPTEEVEEVQERQAVSMKHAIIGFLVAAAVIVWAGMTLTQVGDQIAIQTGLGHTFVGTLLIAATTSLPELVATIAAIKIGAHDMAVGNVFGSNIFNMIVITVADLAYYPGSIFSAVNIDHTITAMAGIILSAIALIGLFYRTQRTILTIGWDSVFIIAVYIATVYLIFIT